MLIKDFCTDEFETYPSSTEIWFLKDHLLDTNLKYIISMCEKEIHGIFSVNFLLQKMLMLVQSADDSVSHDLALDNIQPDLTFTALRGDFPINNLKNLQSDVAILINQENQPFGIVDHIRWFKLYTDYAGNGKNEIKETLLEYESIFKAIDDEIFVTDQHGYILRLNPAAERVCGVKGTDVYGKHVTELEKEGIISASISTEVLLRKCKVHMIQKLKSGKKVLGTAIPIFNDEGEIARVVATSKDVVELNKLKAELEETRSKLAMQKGELNSLRERLQSRTSFIAQSEAMNQVKEVITKIAPMDLTVLIQGESGVGKEVVTKTIHYRSSRSGQPFIKINCGLIPENLIESELFGYEGGSFTGAKRGGKIGKIELANNGTLFLDEIGELPLLMQVKLLEFLQDRQIERVGGTKKIGVDTRIITATNRDLLQMIQDGLFREDLYYRLNVVPIVIPPLRKRRDDIPLLVMHFLDKFNAKYGINKGVTPEAMAAFTNYDWPGNVRELEHVLERVMVMNDSDTITMDYLRGIFEPKSKGGKVICTDLLPLKTAKREVERYLVQTAYDRYKSTYKAAEILEIDQSTVVKIMKKYRKA